MSYLCCSGESLPIRLTVRLGRWIGAETVALFGHRLTLDPTVVVSAVLVVSSVGPGLG